MPIKTTIDANAPILMQRIVSSPERLNKEAEAGRHPLPNTETFPHRQRLVNMAKMESDRLICLYYLGDTLNDGQNQQMQDLEKLAPNIRAIDFNKLDWSEYDFEFNTNMLSVEDEGENMKMTEYLKLPNTDNRLGFRVDMMRTLMLLKAEQGVIEASKVKAGENIGRGAIFFDFDISLSGKMGELEAPYGILSGYSKGVSNVLDFFFFAIAAVTESKNPTLTNAYKNIKKLIGPNNDGNVKESKLEFKNCINYISICLFSFDKSQNCLMYWSVACAIVDSIFATASKEVQSKVQGDAKLLESLIKKDEICFKQAALRNRARVVVNSDTINGKKCRSWVISEDPNTNKNFGSNTTYTEIFETMYKDTELEIKNSISTNLKNVEQEQDKGYCILQ